MFKKGVRVKVLYPYQKKSNEDITAAEGDILRVLSAGTDHGWIKCLHEKSGERGDYPESYVVLDDQGQEGFVEPEYEDPDSLKELENQESEDQEPNSLKEPEDQDPENLADPENHEPETPVVPEDQDSSSGLERSQTVEVYDDDDKLDKCYTIIENFSATLGDELSVKNGEVVIWKMENDSTKSRHNFLFVESCKVPGQKGFVPNNNLSRSTELESKPWYIGTLSREEAKTLLKRPVIEDGTFLVRKSENRNGYVISVKDFSVVKNYRHWRIFEANGFCYAWNEFHHQNVIDLIAFHQDCEQRKLEISYNKFNCNEPTANIYEDDKL